MSSEDLFLDTESSPEKNASSDLEFSPSSPLRPNQGPTPGSPSPIPNKATHPQSSSLSMSSPPTQHSPSTSSFPEGQGELSQNWYTEDSEALGVGSVKQIKIEFYDDNGLKVCQSRYSKDSSIINIVRSLIRSNEPTYRNETVGKFCKTPAFKPIIQDHILRNLSDQFSSLISSERCPLICDQTYSASEELLNVDFENIFQQCLERDMELVNSICVLCFGLPLASLSDKKHLKQRLMAVIAISTFTRNQKANLTQKILGEYFKFSNTGQQGLQLLQRLGLTLVPQSIRETQDSLGSDFLDDVKEEKKLIEEWHRRRTTLEKMIMEKKLPRVQHHDGLCVQYQEEKFIDQILDLGEHLTLIEDEFCPEPDPFIRDLVQQTGGEREALEQHLDMRPKYYDITYDNLDIGRTPREYLMGQDDQSLHWTSSIIVKDVIDAKEISDDKVERNDDTFEERISLTMPEKEHLLGDYVQFLCNIIQ